MRTSVFSVLRGGAVVTAVLASAGLALPQAAGAATPASAPAAATAVAAAPVVHRLAATAPKVVAPATSYGCAGSQIDTYNVKLSSGAVWGVVHLYYDAATRDNCAVNVKTTAGGYGTSTWTTVDLSSSSSGQHSDDGYYTEYAGPVSVYAPSECVAITASVGSGTSVAKLNTGNVHCG
ncbi:hypothetical protein POF50_008060 [Streptomyces sp. SL13]|uniref:Spore-associated protein A n=1 Tax=Streptantibioticus silvisoli TaxID=2705255 RepID=A0AA90KFT3_9ACTN|nr:hypothetical protein [Streptantibioticus silvisoli]MDI5969299.1 hypothetical protein [Streptantibioticus silvisoli]